MNKKIFLYLAIFGSISVQAQERWSLRQCIDYAIEHNISIRQTANAAEQSKYSQMGTTAEPECQCRPELELGTYANSHQK